MKFKYAFVGVLALAALGGSVATATAATVESIFFFLKSLFYILTIFSIRKVDGPVIGIDLGTTYSCVGIFKNGRVEIIANDQGNRITPSVVAFTDDGERLIGEAAKNQGSMNPTNTVFDVKRLIGRAFESKEVQRDRKLMPYTIADKDGKPVVQLKVKVKIGFFFNFG